MDSKTVSKFRARIKRAKSSFSVGGDMLLCMDIDQMSLNDLRLLKVGLQSGRAPISYKYLDQRIEKLGADSVIAELGPFPVVTSRTLRLVGSS